MVSFIITKNQLVVSMSLCVCVCTYVCMSRYPQLITSTMLVIIYIYFLSNQYILRLINMNINIYTTSVHTRGILKY